MLCGLRMPSRCRSASRRHHRRAADVGQPAGRIGSSLVYGSTVKPSATSRSAASSSSTGVRQQRVLVTDDLELDPVGLERLAGQLRGLHRLPRR